MSFSFSFWKTTQNHLSRQAEMYELESWESLNPFFRRTHICQRRLHFQNEIEDERGKANFRRDGKQRVEMTQTGGILFDPIQLKNFSISVSLCWRNVDKYVGVTRVIWNFVQNSQKCITINERCKESRRRRVVSLELIDHCKRKPHNFLSPFSLKQGSPFQALDWTTQVPPMPRISRLGKYVEKSLMYHCYFCDTTTRRKGRRTAAKHSGEKSLKSSIFQHSKSS